MGRVVGCLGVVVGLPLLVLGVLLLPTYSSSHFYKSAGDVVHGSTLYLIDYRSRSVRQGLPFPERPPERLLSERYQLASVDLARQSPVKTLGKPIEREAPFSTMDSPSIVVIDARGEPGMMTYAERDARIRSAAKLPCDAEIFRDRQDFRVLYSFCDRTREMYRYEIPFDRATRIVLPEGSSLEYFAYHHEFRSSLGDSALFVSAGKPDRIHRVDLAGASPSELLDVDPEKIVGITSSLRVQQVSGPPARLEVLVQEAGRPDRTWTFDGTVPRQGAYSRRYLAANGYAIWELDVGGDRLLTLNVRTGDFATIVIPR